MDLRYGHRNGDDVWWLCARMFAYHLARISFHLVAHLSSDACSRVFLAKLWSVMAMPAFTVKAEPQSLWQKLQLITSEDTARDIPFLPAHFSYSHHLFPVTMYIRLLGASISVQDVPQQKCHSLFPSLL